MKMRPKLIVSNFSIAICCLAYPAFAQDAASTSAISGQGSSDEIVVTANKRVESISDVPMSISALSGDALVNSGVTDVSQLDKVTPGLTFTKTHDGRPVLTVRGIGYYDNYIGASPAVSAYMDEVPLPYPVLLGGAFLDLERVEVLKGPQGTLFGQNSTGGAINFIAAKPTDKFAAEASLSYGRFNTVEVSGHVSGPLGDNFGARVAGRFERADGWQRSYTRDDELGAVKRGSGRVLIDFDDGAGFRALASLDGWFDHSETQAGQLRGLQVQIPPLVDPAIGIFTGTGVTQVYPNSPRTPRAADWTPDRDYAARDDYLRGSLRLDYDVLDAVTLTSITAYQTYNGNARFDSDATAVPVADLPTDGSIKAFYQEVRASGQFGPARITVGGNVSASTVDYTSHSNFEAWSVPFDNLIVTTRQKEDTVAAFANLDMELMRTLSLVAGARYTNVKLSSKGCPRDSGDGLAAAGVNGLIGADIVVPGGCYSLNDLVPPSDPGFLLPAPLDSRLKEDNVSWRVGLNWKPNDDVLVYANVNRGYKAGSYPLGAFNFLSAGLPATQETVLAYEAGLKLSGQKYQISAAVFHYDYKDKQILAPYDDPLIGTVDKLLNIPKSKVRGAEADIKLFPAPGLRLGFNVTYIDSEVTSSFVAADPFGGPVPIDLKGREFPFTPNWQGGLDASYAFAVGRDHELTLGAQYSFRTKSLSRFGGGDVFVQDSNGLLDLRAALESNDGGYMIEVFGRNVTNDYYANVTGAFDTYFAFAGRPVTYGIRGTFRFR